MNDSHGTKSSYDTIVVGGGLLGLGTAYHLARLGQSVLVVDRHDVGRATDAGAGILSPATTGLEGDAFRFAVAAGDYYPRLIAALEEDGAGETGYGSAPVLEVAMADDDMSQFARTRERILARKAMGFSFSEALREVSPEEARALFPPLGAVRGAILDPHGARIDGRFLMAALARGGERHGLRVRQGSVEGVEVEAGRVSGVRVDGERLLTANVVLAAGAWAAPLAAQLGIDLPVHPQRGQILHVAMAPGALGAFPAVVGMRGHYLLSWPDGHVVMGATRETGSGFVPELTAAGEMEVLSEGLRVAPGLGSARIREWRIGLRPLADDRLPILGPVPGVRGAYLATGHGAGGLLLGPYSSKVLADAVASGTASAELAPFAIMRFPHWRLGEDGASA